MLQSSYTTRSGQLLPPTSIRNAWALIKRGGATPGHRPRTLMAWLVEAVVRDGKVVEYRAYLMGNNMTTRNKHPRSVLPAAIIAQWRFDQRPTLEAIKAVQRKLPKEPVGATP